MKWSWLTKKGKEDQLTEDELNEMAWQLRRWAADLDAEARKEPEPIGDVIVHPDGRYEVVSDSDKCKSPETQY